MANFLDINFIMVSDARIPETILRIPFNILALSMRIETEDLKPRIETLQAGLSILKDEISPLVSRMEILYERFTLLIGKVDDIRADATPIWADDYNLCGNPLCDRECRICQEGEYDGEEEYTEKYCRRGRR